MTGVDAFVAEVAFDPNGLVPAIAQQYDTGEVLMMAWMNRDALIETIETQQVCYWSRSRQSLWRKGETSDQVQRVIDVRVDCDGDTVLIQVDQTGVACHTGRRSCFYRRAGSDGIEEIEMPKVEPKRLYGN